MNVKELIDLLKTFPKDLEVKYESETFYFDIDNITIIEKNKGYDKDNPRFVLLD